MPSVVTIAPGLALTGRGAALVEGAGALVIADVHLGYARAARRRGGWLPQAEGAPDAAARALEAARAVGATRLVIAGDLRHSTRDADAAEHAEVGAFLRATSAALPTTLVAGNHDRGAARYADAGIDVVTGVLALGDVDVSHEPPAAAPTRWTVCGHLHPATTVRDATGAGMKVPCALVGPRVLVLPAFGEWAGGVAASRLRRSLFVGAWTVVPVAAGEVWPFEPPRGHGHPGDAGRLGA